MPPKPDYYVITGIQDGLLNEPKDVKDPLRKVGIRMDIDDWFVSKDPIHVNQRAIFFPAMKMFCDASPDKKLSFFQIAGNCIADIRMTMEFRLKSHA
jgi:tyrosinase